MISPFEISSVADALAFVFWTFGVLALTKYVFASFFTAEFTNWAFRLTPELRQRITQLQWELRENAHWDDDVVRGSPHAAKRSLAKPERSQRQMEFDRLTRQSFWRRAGLYALQCFMCQSFWVALILFVVCHEGAADHAGARAGFDAIGDSAAIGLSGVPCLRALIETFTAACCYGGLAMALNKALSLGPHEQPQPNPGQQRRRGGCPGGNCGG